MVKAINALLRARASKGAHITARKLARFALMSAAAIISLLPLANIVYIIATTGANTPSSDDAFFMQRFLGQALDGTYEWRFFIGDTFFFTHSNVFPHCPI